MRLCGAGSAGHAGAGRGGERSCGAGFAVQHFGERAAQGIKARFSGLTLRFAFLCLVFFRQTFGVVAGLPSFAVVAIIRRVAGALLRSEFIAGGGAGDGIDCIGGHDFMSGMLRGDLKAIEDEAGALVIEMPRADGAENL